MPSSAAGNALAYSGSGMSLMQEVADETDEERRKRLLQQQSQRLLLNSSAAGQALGLTTTGYSAALGS
jgi:hypothetical protein